MKKFMFIAILALISASVSSYGFNTPPLTATAVNNYDFYTGSDYAFRSAVYLLNLTDNRFRKPILIASGGAYKAWGWIGNSSGTGLYGYYGPTSYAISNGLWDGGNGTILTVPGTRVATGAETSAANFNTASVTFYLSW